MPSPSPDSPNIENLTPGQSRPWEDLPGGAPLMIDHDFVERVGRINDETRDRAQRTSAHNMNILPKSDI